MAPEEHGCAAQCCLQREAWVKPEKTEMPKIDSRVPPHRDGLQEWSGLRGGHGFTVKRSFTEIVQ